jgi:hypothetical protein
VLPTQGGPPKRGPEARATSSTPAVRRLIRRFLRSGRRTRRRSAANARSRVPARTGRNARDCRCRRACRQFGAAGHQRERENESRRKRRRNARFSLAKNPIIQEILRQGQRLPAKVRRRYILAALETGRIESNFTNPAGGDADSEGWRQERASLYRDPRNIKDSVARFYQEAAQHGSRATVVPTRGGCAASRGAVPRALPDRAGGGPVDSLGGVYAPPRHTSVRIRSRRRRISRRRRP